VKSSFELSRHDWPRGLSHAGWSLYLVLAPFVNLGALRAALGRPVSDVGRNKALRLPLALSLVSLLAFVLAAAGLVLTMAEQLGS
jgi:hypothetical protein